MKTNWKTVFISSRTPGVLRSFNVGIKEIKRGKWSIRVSCGSNFVHTYPIYSDRPPTQEVLLRHIKEEYFDLRKTKNLLAATACLLFQKLEYVFG